MDVPEYNRQAWDRQVAKGNVWTRPVDTGLIEAARNGEWSLLLTPLKPVPRSWFQDDLSNCKVLCLASGGGQQGPILAAAGADVTVFDNSSAQLAQDDMVARRHDLAIVTELGDMCDLSRFTDETFDLVFHPVSKLFCGIGSAGLARGSSCPEAAREFAVGIRQSRRVHLRSEGLQRG